MAKKSQRRPPRCEKDHTGCIWGLISLFDFRQGHLSTRKLLSGRRRGSRHAVGAGYSDRLNLLTSFNETCNGIDDGDKSKLKVDVSKKSVKKLMEEEISSEQQPKHLISNAAVKQIGSDSKYGSYFGKKCKQRNKTSNGACNIHAPDLKASAILDAQQPHDPNAEEQSSNEIDLAAEMEEFCSQIYQSKEVNLHHENERDTCDVQKIISCTKHSQLDELNMQLIQKNSNLQEKLIEATEAVLNQKFIGANQHTRDGAIHQSKQIMDALEIVNSNKELFLKLLQDPNSRLVQHIQDLQDAQVEVKQSKPLADTNFSGKKIGNSRQCEELLCHKQNIQTFFRRRIKSQNRDPSKGSDNPQALNRIVVLKPGPEGTQNSETETSPSSSPRSHYSLRNEGQKVRITSHFSLRKIRRKLKHVMGESRKEQHWSPMEGILHRTPYKQQDSEDGGSGVAGRNLPSETSFHPERITKPFINVKSKGKIEKSKYCKPSNGHEDVPTSVDGLKYLNMTDIEYSKQRESNFYLEAKKQLADMLITGNEDADLSSRQIPRTLGVILSQPEFNLSPIFSPEEDRQHIFVTAQISPYDNFQMVSENMWWIEQENNSSHLSPLRQNIETPLCNNDNKVLVSNSNSDIWKGFLHNTKIQEITCSATEELSLEGDVTVVEISDIECTIKSNLLDVPSEPKNGKSITTTNQSMDVTNICKKEEASKCLRLDSPEENQPSASSLGPFLPSSLLIQKVKDLEGISDKTKQPIPVSILEPFNLENVISPATTESQPVELPIQPLQIHSEEYESSASVLTVSDPEIYSSCMENKKSVFEYVRAVLQASGLSWDKLMGRWHSSEQLLDLSVFDEVEVLSSQLCGDRKLLFDCINEVLVEVYKRYFVCSPWASFVKPNTRPAPIGTNFICEVWEGIDWHLLPPLPPQTLDQIVGKDMAKAGKWMDLRFNTEIIATEMGDTILEELTEETIYELCL